MEWTLKAHEHFYNTIITSKICTLTLENSLTIPTIVEKSVGLIYNGAPQKAKKKN